MSQLFRRVSRILGRTRTRMGEIRAAIRLENLEDVLRWKRRRLPKGRVRIAEVEGLVDTGARVLALPADLVVRLGLPDQGRAVARLANNRSVRLRLAGPVSVTIRGRTMSADCLVVPRGSEILIGQEVLERLDLIADPGRRALTPRPESPDLPMFNV